MMVLLRCFVLWVMLLSFCCVWVSVFVVLVVVLRFGIIVWIELILIRLKLRFGKVLSLEIVVLMFFMISLLNLFMFYVIVCRMLLNILMMILCRCWKVMFVYLGNVLNLVFMVVIVVLMNVLRFLNDLMKICVKV